MRTNNLTHKVKMLAVLLMLSVASDIKAQIYPVHNIQSPEVANLGMYGTIPVSHYTGIPDISIPLYDIKVGDYVLPLSVSYHLASVKPNLPAGIFGMGWSLMAGGYITRTVNCVYDEMCEDNNVCHGFYSHASKMKNITEPSFAKMTNENLRGDNFFELTPDEFSFNFCGYTGNFYYNEDGGWTVFSDYDIKVEFNPANGEGFISKEQLDDRFNLSDWAAKGHHNRFFNKFTLITPDGCRYEFGGLSATEFSAPYYSRRNSPLTPTTWRLSKITTTDKREIVFNYDTSALMCDIRYVPQKRMQYNMMLDPNTNNEDISWRGLTGFLLFPVNLISITTPNESIVFTYFKDTIYKKRFDPTNKYLYWEKTGWVRYQTYNPYMEDPAAQFRIFTGVNKLWNESEYQTRQAIADSLAHYMLHRIAIKNRFTGNGHSIYFGYTANSEGILKLTSLLTKNGIPDLIGGQDGYEIPAETQDDDMPAYSFSYNDDVIMPVIYPMTKTDSWGFFKGGRVYHGDTPTYSVIPPSFESTKAETLSRITYPTGGFTEFTYELHRFSKILSSDHITIKDSIGKAGGLRVSEIKNYNSDSSLINTKKYHYSEIKDGKSSGISRSLPPYYVAYTNGDKALELFSSGGFQTPVTNQNTPDVGYSCVIEETLDASGHSMGWTKYRYSNYDTDIFGTSHPDEKYTYFNASGGVAIAPYTSHAQERGKLQSEEVYDSNGILKSKRTIKYDKTGHQPFTTAYQQEVILNYSPIEFLSANLGWLAETTTFSYLPKTVCDTIYTKSGAYSTSTTYSYNPNKLVKSESTQTSKNTVRTIQYKYPSDDVKYNWMKQRNILSPIIEKYTAEDSYKCTETFEYKATDLNKIPYISKKTTSWGDNATARTDFKVNAVNDYGKPTEVEVGGRTKVYYWGFYGQKLFAEMENITLAEAEEIFGYEYSVSDYNYNFYDDFYELWEGVYYGGPEYRHLLPNALFHYYLYNLDMRMYAEILPDGSAIQYKYDKLGRLREKYYIDSVSGKKKILNQYDYHYK